MSLRFELIVKNSLLIFFLGLVSSSAFADTMTVAAASDLRFALDACIAAFAKSHPDTEVKVVYGSSGNLCAQIGNGAPFDLFLSADRKYPDRLIEEGRTQAETLFLYGIGRLVLWVPEDSRIDVRKLQMAGLNDPAARRVAIANPDHAPYGQAAVAAMKSLGVYEAAQDRLVLGDNIAQTAQFLESGAADIGIIALSLAVSPVMEKKGRYWEIPTSTYPQMIQAGIVTNQASNPSSVGQFIDFLKSPGGQDILKKFGFTMPEKE